MDMKYAFPQIVFVAVEHLLRPLVNAYNRVRVKWLCWRYGIVADKNVRIQGNVIIRTRFKGEIKLGKNVILNSAPKTNLVGLLGPTILDTCGGGKIEFGDYSGASSVVISSHSGVTIGKYVKIGGNVRIFDHDFHALDPMIRRSYEDLKNVRTKPVLIDDDVFIGTNVIILKGTHIGSRSIVAAGSVVLGLDIPADSMVKGNPAVVTCIKGKKN